MRSVALARTSLASLNHTQSEMEEGATKTTSQTLTIRDSFMFHDPASEERQVVSRECVCEVRASIVNRES